MSWACEAYGPEGLELGARCFLAELPGERSCTDAWTCHLVMTLERRRLWRRLHELAAAGDQLAVDVLAHYTGPEQLLGGTS